MPPRGSHGHRPPLQLLFLLPQARVREQVEAEALPALAEPSWAQAGLKLAVGLQAVEGQTGQQGRLRVKVRLVQKRQQVP